MTPLDKDVLVKKIEEIEKDLTFLKELTEKITLEEYKKSEEVQLQAERLLERIIGRAIDINFHILQEEFKTLPKTYRESFLLLEKVGLLSGDIAPKIAPLSGLRNILAHEYDSIDVSKVYQGIQAVLEYIPLYLEAIVKYLGES